MHLLAPALIVLAGCGGPGEPKAAPVALGIVGVTGSVERKGTDRFIAETGVQVSLLNAVEDVDKRLEQYQGFLERGATSPDVYLIDVTWPGILAEHLVDLGPALGVEVSRHFPEIVRNNMVAGRLVGMPQFTDVGLLYYRTDLLQKYGYPGPPETWDELEVMAARIQAGERAAGNKAFWGYVWQGAATEGLTCNALEWQVSHGGGKIVEDDRTISVNNAAAARAMKRAARWIGSISPPGVLTHREDDSRNVWEAGRAAFMRNWPFRHLSGEAPDSPIRGRFALGALPSGGFAHAHTLGGWQLAVSKYSRHPQEAIAFVRYMTSEKVQKSRVFEGSTLPTIAALYDDPEVVASMLYLGRLKPILTGGAIARPSSVTGKKYAAVSRAYYTAVHEILAGRTTAEGALAGLEDELVRRTGFQRGPPALAKTP